VTAGQALRSGAYTVFCSRLLFPLHELAKRHDSTARRRALEESQWWAAERIEEHRVRRLREFLSGVASNVPYYAALFRTSGFDPRGLRGVADLAAIPFLTKALIRSNTEALKARDAGSLMRYNTGGSSGEPLVFFMGRDRVSHDVAAKWRATRWWGVDIGDREIVVWGSPIELGAQDRVRSIRDRLLRTTLLPAFEMSEAKLDAFVTRIRALRPAMLFGYPSALAHIARHAAGRGQMLDDVGIRVAFVTSERLYPEQRELIARVFGCAVANGYGGRDAGFIAHECPSGGMHITAEDVIVETVDGDGRVQGPGVPGEIVVTHLATGSFPFIRYRTGDVGVLDDRACACGRGLPLIKEIQGRTTDFVVARDGTVMHGLALVYIVRDLPGIRKFKILQESVDHTRVLLAVEAGFDDGNVARIKAGMAQRLGQEVRIDVDMVADIPAEASGKYRYVVSKAVAT
jgi:phenylacetate-coenzyme A ligase PaaK-like adenylate-forming protein